MAQAEKKKRRCGYEGCKTPLDGGRRCYVCKKSISCPRCARCHYCSGDFARA